MGKNVPEAGDEPLERRIIILRGRRVMLAGDLARLYGVTTKRLNEQFKRNQKRFPKDFAFRLTREETAHLSSPMATSPYAFTQHGVLMLAGVLDSPIAIRVSIEIIRAWFQTE